MDADTLELIFDPFFTTKDLGRGTGLGLSTVYGIVKQSGGFIYAEGRPDEGSTFRVFLPQVDEEPSAAQVGPAKPCRGAETILLVEDDPAVRSLTHRILTTQGYEVLESASGSEALSVAKANKGRIDLLITDIVMPGMDGRELADQLAEIDPETRVLYMSGYSDEKIWARRRMNPTDQLLHKPFTLASLVEKVREVLERSPSPK